LVVFELSQLRQLFVEEFIVVSAAQDGHYRANNANQDNKGKKFLHRIATSRT